MYFYQNKILNLRLSTVYTVFIFSVFQSTLKSFMTTIKVGREGKNTHLFAIYLISHETHTNVEMRFLLNR